MKRKFTKMMAALALLMGLMIPLGMWGQSTAGFTLTGMPSGASSSSTSGTITGSLSETWNWSATFSTGATSSAQYSSWQIGSSSKPCTQAVFSTSGISGTITNIAVNCGTKNAAGEVNCTVGGSNFGTQNQSTGTGNNPTNYGTTPSFSGSASGEIIITITNTQTYISIKSITVTYTTGGGGGTTYTVTYNANGGTGTLTDPNSPYQANATVTVLANTFTKTGHTFEWWSDMENWESTGANVYDPTDNTSNTFTITQNTTLYAQWSVNTHDITMPVTDTYGSYTASATTNVAYGTTVTLTYTPATGYEDYIATWSVNGAAIDGDSFTMPDENVTVTVSVAQYEQPTEFEIGLNNTLFETNYNGSVSDITDENPIVGSKNGVTVTYAGTGYHYVSNDQIRFYPNNKLTFEAPSGYEITEIVFTADGTWTATINANNGEYHAGTKNWTGSASSVLFTGSGSGRCDMAKATITLAEPAAQHTLTATMTNVAEYFVFVEGDPIEFDANNQAQVSAGATVGVSIAAMNDCYLFGSFTVNGSTITQENPDDLYFEFTMPDEDAEIVVTTTDAIQYNLTVVGLDNVTYTYFLKGVGSDEVTFTNNQTTICEGMPVNISGLSANSGLSLQSVTLTAGNNTQTLTPDEGVYYFTMPSSNATLTFTTAAAQTYTLATSIESGKTYIIVGFDGEDAYAMAEQKSNNRAGVGITVNGNTAIGNSNVHEVLITALEGDDAGKYTIEDNGYLYASSSSGNQLKTEANLDADGNGKWTIVIDGDGAATITAQGSNSRNRMRFNPNVTSVVPSPLFACYATSSTTGSLPRLYEKDEPATETYTLTVTGYSDYSAKDGYCLIASPVTVDPATVEGMVVADTDPNYEYFDLYSFANDQDDEWQNYKYNQFNLVPGTGYLYAKKATTEGETFSFQLTGIPYSGDGLFELTNAGWNLVGNPFYANVTVDAQEFLVMNGDGSQIIPAESSTIAPMQGIFVYANEEGESVTFIQADGNANPNSNPSVVMNLIQNRGSVIDRAIVRFGEGNQLPKFQLFENSTELYIPQDNEDYAIVRGEAQGELPVSFRAAENGTYTLSMNVENVDMNYLHLIDNMTGMDVDLLQTPSYTFEANTNDYANRFKLVFAANGANEADEASFAFFSNGNLIVNNEGNATLQVIDINGRILSSETISGSCSKAIHATTGVYMLRLINGDNVKVQKVVVR